MPGQKRLSADDAKKTQEPTPNKKRRSGPRSKGTATAVVYTVGFTEEEVSKLRKDSTYSLDIRKNISSEITHLAFKSVNYFDCLASYFGVISNTYFVRSTYLSSPKLAFIPNEKDQFMLTQIDVRSCRKSKGLNVKEVINFLAFVFSFNIIRSGMQNRDGLENMFGERTFKRALIVGNPLSADYKERHGELKTIIEAGGGSIRGTKEYNDLLRRPADMHEFASIIILMNETDLEDAGMDKILVQRALNCRLPIVTEESIKNWIRLKAGPVTFTTAMETAANHWRDSQVPLTDEAFQWAAFGKGTRQADIVFARMSLPRSQLLPSNVPTDDRSPRVSNTLNVMEIEREIEENQKKIDMGKKILEYPDDERDPNTSVVFSPPTVAMSEHDESSLSLSSAKSKKKITSESHQLTLSIDYLNWNTLADATWLQANNHLRQTVLRHRRTFAPISFPKTSRNEQINAEYDTDYETFNRFRAVIDFLKHQDSSTPAFTFAAHDLMMDLMHRLRKNSVPHTTPLSFILHKVAMVKFAQMANLQESACKLIAGLINRYPTNGDGIRRIYWLKVFSELAAEGSGGRMRTKDHNIEIRTKSFREKIVAAFTSEKEFGSVLRKLILQLLALDLFSTEFMEEEQRKLPDPQSDNANTVDAMSSTARFVKVTDGLGLPLAALFFVDCNNTRKTALTKLDHKIIMNVVRFMADNENNHVVVEQGISFITICFEAIRYVEFKKSRKSCSQDETSYDLRHDFIQVLLAFRKYGWSLSVIRSFFSVNWMKTIAMEEKWFYGSLGAF